LVVKVFSKLTDHVDEIIIFGIELDDFDFDDFDVGFLIVVDEEFVDIFLEDIKMEFVDHVVDVFEGDVLNLWGFVIQEGEERTSKFLHYIIEVLRVQLHITEVDFGDG
jgi:hypothetical protein